jgi:magnesium chelatase subunit D
VLAAGGRRDELERGAIGRRERSLVALRRGKYSRHGLFRPRDSDVAVDATLRAAAVRSGGEGAAIAVTTDDMRRKVREHHVPFEVCFVVDNSYSLRAEELVEKVKGLVFRLIEDATGRGDRVALVAFKGGVPEATVALRPTRSRALAARALRDVPLSGRTPLADALRMTARLLRQERAKRPNARPLAVIVTDGLPNVPLLRGGDPVQDCVEQCRALRRAGVGVVVVDAEPRGAAGSSCGGVLAEAARGLHVPLADVSPDAFAAVLARTA